MTSPRVLRVSAEDLWTAATLRTNLSSRLSLFPSGQQTGGSGVVNHLTGSKNPSAHQASNGGAHTSLGSSGATNVAAATRRLTRGPKGPNLGRPNKADERDDAQPPTSAGGGRRRRKTPVTVRPLPVVTSRGSAGFKRRRLLLLCQSEDSQRTPAGPAGPSGAPPAQRRGNVWWLLAEV